MGLLALPVISLIVGAVFWAVAKTVVEGLFDLPKGILIVVEVSAFVPGAFLGWKLTRRLVDWDKKQWSQS